MKKLDTYDTLIIGSGVAGLAVASKILGKFPDASILMLEAGPKVKMKDFGLFQEYLITGKLPYTFCQDLPYPSRDENDPSENASVGPWDIPLQGARLMTYGGSTVHWGGWSFRLKPEDFELKTRTNKGIDWPISYDDLEPYYVQSEHLIGVAGDADDNVVPRSEPFPYLHFPYTLEDGQVIGAMEKAGVTYSHLPIARRGISGSASSHAPCQTTGTCKYCPFGARFVAGNYLDDMVRLENYPNFDIQHEAIVEEILMSSESEASGVRYLDKATNEKVEVKAGRVIVAAGAIESAKLLLRSKSGGHNRGLGNGNDLVGRNFITHPYFIFQATLPANPDRLQPEMNFPTLVSRHYDNEEEQPKGKFIIINSPSSPLVKLGSMMQNGKTREEMDETITGETDVQLHGIIEVFSEDRNSVSNLDKVNHLGLIETTVNYTKPEGFDDRMEEVEKHIGEIFEKMGAKNPKRIMVSWRADHAACLTRMSDSAATGVVDSDLKIFDVDNVYICSNASFSSLGAVNPTLTLGALSLRLGDHLVEQISKS